MLVYDNRISPYNKFIIDNVLFTLNEYYCNYNNFYNESSNKLCKTLKSFNDKNKIIKINDIHDDLYFTNDIKSNYPHFNINDSLITFHIYVDLINQMVIYVSDITTNNYLLYPLYYNLNYEKLYYDKFN